MAFKVRLNSIDKTEALLQEIYDDAVRQITMINNQMNELRESSNLAEAMLDSKTKYAKSMHDYNTDIQKAKQLKLDVSKLLIEVLKFNGNVEKALSESEVISNLDSDFQNIRNQVLKPDSESSTPKTTEYLTDNTRVKRT